MMDEVLEENTTETQKCQRDSTWKEAINKYFQSFVELFWPEIYDEIDWSKGYELLEQEFHLMHQYQLKDKRIIDKLIKVFRHDGKEAWVVILLEIQGQLDPDFAERVFIYFYKKYRVPIACLAIYIDSQPNWRPSQFDLAIWDTKLTLKFPTMKVLDYKDKKEFLKKSHNPFAAVILAQLAAIEAAGKDEVIMACKLDIIKSLYLRRAEYQETVEQYRYMEGLLPLSKGFSLQYHREIKRIEEEYHMSYITTAIEERGMEAKIEGKIEGELEMLFALLNVKFGNIPKFYLEHLQRADAKYLIELGKKLINATSIEEVFADV